MLVSCSAFTNCRNNLGIHFRHRRLVLEGSPWSMGETWKCLKSLDHIPPLILLYFWGGRFDVGGGLEGTTPVKAARGPNLLPQKGCAGRGGGHEGMAPYGGSKRHAP